MRIFVYMGIYIFQMRGWKENTLLNPGSISQPRGVINERLYAKVEISDDAFQSGLLYASTRTVFSPIKGVYLMIAKEFENFLLQQEDTF